MMFFKKKKDKNNCLKSTINNVLRDFYDNTEKVYEMEGKLYDNTQYNWYLSFEHYLIFEKNDIRIKVAKSNEILLWEYNVYIYIDNIAIYSTFEKWIYSVPEEMLLYIKNVIEELKNYNDKCVMNKLGDSYEQHKREQELKKEREKIIKYEKDKQYLIDKFSKNKKVL